MRSSAPSTGLAVFSRLKLNSLAKTVLRYYNGTVSYPSCVSSNKAGHQTLKASLALFVSIYCLLTWL
jgi:hypothetical protein